MTRSPSFSMPVQNLGWSYFATRDPEEARRFLRRRYAANTLRADNRPRGFVLDHRERGLGPVRVVWLRLTAPSELSIASSSHATVVSVLDGRLRGRDDTGEWSLGPGECRLVLPSVSTVLGWNSVTAAVTTAPMAALCAAVGPSGSAPRGGAPVSEALAQHWWRTLVYVGDELVPVATRDGQLATLAARMLMTTMLRAFPRDQVVERLPVGRSMTALAMDFIERHAAERPELADIAAAARVSPRGLQLAFRRELGTTPMGYLRDIRLHRAHEELRQSRPGRSVTVTDVAHRWGFSSAGRFAAAYRDMYGESPSATLRAAVTADAELVDQSA